MIRDTVELLVLSASVLLFTSYILVLGGLLLVALFSTWEYVRMKYAIVGMIINAVIIYYLYRPNVRSYFGRTSSASI